VADEKKQEEVPTITWGAMEIPDPPGMTYQVVIGDGVKDRMRIGSSQSGW
jgi:hypothetical protein